MLHFYIRLNKIMIYFVNNKRVETNNHKKIGPNNKPNITADAI